MSKAFPARSNTVGADAAPSSFLSRRRFLFGVGALGVGGVSLAACSGSASGVGASGDGPQLVNLFSPDHVIAAGREQRIPFAVVESTGLGVNDGAAVPVSVMFDGEVIDELTVVGRVVEHDHVSPETDPNHQHANLLRYYALRASFPQPGVYDLQVDFGSDRVASLPVQAFDPAEVAVAMVGEELPAIITPTADAPEGIRPLCTRAPEPCPFHTLSVDEALGRPLALLVATPALCTTAYCGPVLETLIAEAADFADVTMVHLEVYANAADVGGNYDDPALAVAEPVNQLGLAFEPSLFLVDAAGVIVDRIDNLFDRTELRASLDSLNKT